MESGYGLVTAMHQVNEYRVELDLLYIGYTTVRSTMKYIDPAKRSELSMDQCKIKMGDTVVSEAREIQI
jgi:hypothetical protein